MPKCALWDGWYKNFSLILVYFLTCDSIDMRDTKTIVQGVHQIGGGVDGFVKTGSDFTQLFQGVGVTAGAFDQVMLPEPLGDALVGRRAVAAVYGFYNAA